MIRHMLKLVWNRKRMNALIILEISFSFLVLFSVFAGLAYVGNNVRQPIGFSYDNVWNVSIDVGQDTDDEFTRQQASDFERVLRETSSMPFVAAAAGSLTPPFSFGGSDGVWRWKGRDIKLTFDEVTDEFRDVVGLEVVEGRWFEPNDGAQAWRAVVLDRDSAKAIFPDGSAVGQTLPIGEERGGRVVGVAREYRKDGELSGNTNFVFKRVHVGSAASRPPRNIVIRVLPGSTASNEQALVKRLQAVVPNWSFEVTTIDQMREQQRRLQLLPIVIGSVISMFLIIMVTLGLTGVMWQNVTRRTREIGLRRALGASRNDVHQQVLFEIVTLSSIALVLGTIILLQIPLLGIVAIPATVFVPALVLALVSILLLAIVCGLYPSRLAANVEPAEALHYE